MDNKIITLTAKDMQTLVEILRRGSKYSILSGYSDTKKVSDLTNKVQEQLEEQGGVYSGNKVYFQ